VLFRPSLFLSLFSGDERFVGILGVGGFVLVPFEWLVQLTPPLKKRAFSISSSPLVHPSQIDTGSVSRLLSLVCAGESAREGC
jgi:hypothetical protein